MKLTFNFYLLNPKGRFDLRGSIGAIDGSSLNQITEPMGPLHIKRGKFNGAEFNLRGYDYSIDGSVKILYQDLKIDMNEKDKGSIKLDKKSLMSFVANIVIINSNPKKNADVRIVQVHNDREINYAIINFSWKTLLKAIKETVGINKILVFVPHKEESQPKK